MKNQTTEIKLSQLVNDLENGLTWLKKDDNGLGSIQEKYGAEDHEILTIQKHPKLRDLEPAVFKFKIVDDLKDDEPTNQVETNPIPQPKGEHEVKEIKQERSEQTPGHDLPSSEESFDNL
jgi:hypothetical protein